MINKEKILYGYDNEIEVTEQLIMKTLNQFCLVRINGCSVEGKFGLLIQLFCDEYNYLEVITHDKECNEKFRPFRLIEIIMESLIKGDYDICKASAPETLDVLISKYKCKHMNVNSGYVNIHGHGPIFISNIEPYSINENGKRIVVTDNENVRHIINLQTSRICKI